MSTHNRKSLPPVSLADYRHDDTRLNNPPAGGAEKKPVPLGRKHYECAVRLDPQLMWAAKKEHRTFDVATVPLYIHERVSPAAIIANLNTALVPRSLLADFDLDPNMMSEFYTQEMQWANRLVLGDSLLVMNSLLEREKMAGKVQCIYFDPPYGVRYASNVQPFVNNPYVREGDDESSTYDSEHIRAFHDTWKLGIHSYLTYLRSRLILMHNLLAESGSIFVQTSAENEHRVRAVMDEVFGSNSFVSLITFTYSKALRFVNGIASDASDYIIWYAKNRDIMKYRPFYLERELKSDGFIRYSHVELPDGNRRVMSEIEGKCPSLLPVGSKIYGLTLLTRAIRKDEKREGSESYFPVDIGGREYRPPSGSCWTVNKVEMDRLIQANRVQAVGNALRYVRFMDDFPISALTNVWDDLGNLQNRFDPRIYMAQTLTTVVTRCMLMSTDPGDLVLDPTCGSGTTAYVAEQWGRRWITCDTSQVALTLSRQRLMTAIFPFFELAQPNQGLRGGFVYESVPHITLKCIAKNELPETETLYDKPKSNKNVVRLSGPFTVEAVQSSNGDPQTIDISRLAVEHTDVVVLSLNPEGYTVTVRGASIQDRNAGDVADSNIEHISAWFLDTDYDGITFLVCQAYFPNQTRNPWEKISQALKMSIGVAEFEALQGLTSLPFKAGIHKQCAVKLIDIRGNEAVMVLRLQ